MDEHNRNETAEAHFWDHLEAWGKDACMGKFSSFLTSRSLHG